ncbi:MAG: uracil-DNA glycosylase [Boseongicola sp.]|nr:uracil-DNA glycosylase [Boseongicola sp.]MDD9978720.1 uracil-DNA glycosylase [Boseongicola sp.]
MTPDIGDWVGLPFFTDHWPSVQTRLAEDNRLILPPDHLRFAALSRCQPAAAKVIILGQDPYPTPGHANGLAFSVEANVALPKSLKNIFKELEDDLGAAPETGDLSPWADQGVLLLNTSLSVPAGNAGGHAKLGWHHLIQDVLRNLSDQPRVFILWGNHAQSMKKHVAGSDHHFIETAHPSPLSAYRGFFGSKPFSRTNTWLTDKGHAPIRWA